MSGKPIVRTRRLDPRGKSCSLLPWHLLEPMPAGRRRGQGPLKKGGCSRLEDHLSQRGEQGSGSTFPGEGMSYRRAQQKEVMWHSEVAVGEDSSEREG